MRSTPSTHEAPAAPTSRVCGSMATIDQVADAVAGASTSAAASMHRGPGRRGHACNLGLTREIDIKPARTRSPRGTSCDQRRRVRRLTLLTLSLLEGQQLGAQLFQDLGVVWVLGQIVQLLGVGL